jgi:predicted DCC family thiol-disulfide oxidoreductase YuxK
VKKIIYFDGICLLCNGLINFLLKHDKKAEFFFSSLQSDYAKKNIPALNLDTIYFQEDKVFYQKSDAILKIICNLGGAWRVFNLFWALPKFLRDGVYNLVAYSRYKIWGKQQECRLPSESERARFIL